MKNEEIKNVAANIQAKKSPTHAVQSISKNSNRNLTDYATTLLVVLMMALVANSPVFSQSGKVVFKIENENDLPQIKSVQNSNTVQLKSADSELEAFFAKHNVYGLKQLYPDSRRPELLKYFVLEADQPGELVNELKKHSNRFSQIREESTAKPLYKPNDYYFDYRYGIDGIRNVTLSYLDLINAPQAWDLTKGDPNVVVGIIDNYLYTEHEDLQGKITKVYDSNNRNLFATEVDHATMVAGLIASNTDNRIGIPSVGFNCRVAKTSFNKNDLLQMAKDGVKVINISQDWEAYREDHQGIINELVEDYGVTVVAAAGNEDSYEYVYPASYDNVISVTSVGHEFDYGTTFKGQQFGWKDCHQKYVHSTRSVTSHQHNDKVDICAPGYNIVTLCHPDTWENGSGETTGQLYNVQDGTSFAAAIVSGVCALMYSVNPNLTPAEVEEIIKSTAVDIYDIPENKPYTGMLGAGRIDAYEAVKKAGNFTGISDNWEKENNFTVYPNPTSGPINFSGVHNADQVEVFSATGKLVKAFDLFGGVKSGSIQELAPGFYILVAIKNNQRIGQFKLLKE
jgi:subtilisin family serine protease